MMSLAVKARRSPADKTIGSSELVKPIGAAASARVSASNAGISSAILRSSCAMSAKSSSYS